MEVASGATASHLTHSATGVATAGLTSTTLARVNALVSYSAVPTGALVLTVASEVNGSAVTVRAGSVLTVRKVA